MTVTRDRTGIRTTEEVKAHMETVSDFMESLNESMGGLPEAHNGCQCHCHRMAGVSHCVPCCGVGINDHIKIEINYGK